MMIENGLMSKALSIQQNAAEVGFDWDSAEPILDKLAEEIEELKEWLPKRFDSSENQELVHGEMEKELGDCFFVLINLARKLGVNPESALLSTIHKFEKRFSFMESELQKLGKTMKESSLEERGRFWEQAKQLEK
ncbi:MAG: MazG nucleotide pyrophosphohydrolase domain-containing protein [Cardiobacteriaceae bacterium]|nr:MazG nucleotide pyrophosphohydrolase domain-containing protein [Cardiobacteriaceae bacterium]